MEYGARLRGILEEMEKPPIYIELLHNRNNSLERELWNVRQVVSELVPTCRNTITFADGSCEVRSRREEEAMQQHR